MRSRFSSYVLICVFGLTALAYGQGTTGSISGTVTDVSGAVLPGVLTGC
jgi:hypothetical protein